MNKGYIYILQSALPDLERFVKVGKTKASPLKRFNDGVQTRAYFKNDILVCGLFLVKDVDEAEKAVHKELDLWRQESDLRDLYKVDPKLDGGLEWFPATVIEARETVRAVCNVYREFRLPETGLTRAQFRVDIKAGPCR